VRGHARRQWKAAQEILGLAAKYGLAEDEVAFEALGITKAP
jgi:hypothetical protein